jgi:hypothetical protein
MSIYRLSLFLTSLSLCWTNLKILLQYLSTKDVLYVYCDDWRKQLKDAENRKTHRWPHPKLTNMKGIVSRDPEWAAGDVMD